jgi:hypothetical protein
VIPEARRLIRMKHARAVMQSDPRLGQEVRRVLCLLDAAPEPPSPQGWSAKELAELIVSEPGITKDPRQVGDALVALRAAIRQKAHMSLEDELADFLSIAGDDRQRQIVARRLGWDGAGGCTLEIAGAEAGITREGVRKMEKRLLAPLTRTAAPPFAPALDAALEFVEGALPGAPGELSLALVDEGILAHQFDLWGLETAAEVLRRDVPFLLPRPGHSGLVLPESSQQMSATVRRVARRSVEQWGAATCFDVAAKVSKMGGEGIEAAIVLDLLMLLVDFEWLDEETGWFWLRSVPRNRLLNQIEKIMAVAPRIHVTELRGGLGRHHRLKGFAPPRRVLLELCRRVDGYRTEGDYVISERPLSWREVLPANEATMTEVLLAHGPLLGLGDLEAHCAAAGMNRSSLSFYLGYSPIIHRYAPGVYGLRGAEVPPGLAESVMPRTPRMRALQDHGRLSDDAVWVAYRLTASTIRSGVVNIPAGLKELLAGTFTLKAEDEAEIGVFSIRHHTGWGLQPYFRRRGGEHGDILLAIFDLATRTVTVHLGDEELLHGLADGGRVPGQP